MILNKFKLFFGFFYFIVCVVFVLLVIFVLLCLGFVMWYFDCVMNVDGWICIFISGLRVDFVLICYLFILFVFLISLIFGEYWLGCIWNWIL